MKSRDGSKHGPRVDGHHVQPLWRLSSLPRCLPDDDVERVIVSCDIASGFGERDRAILLLARAWGYGSWSTF